MTDKKTKSRETKSLLAKLMAAEDINVEYRNNVSTAAFNTESRTLMMPIFKDISESTTDLFLGHEVGHALYTPQGAINDVVKKGGSYKSLVNIVEDARIEKMIQAKFPGLSRNFYDGYAELMDKNFFGLNGRDVNDLNLIDRINIHFKIGTRAGVEFTDEEQVFVDRIAKLRSFDESIAVSDDLLEYCGDKQEESETDMGDFPFESDDGREDDPDDWSSDSYPSGPAPDEDDDTGLEPDDGETSDESAEDSNSDAPSDTDESEDTGEGNNSVESKDDSEDEDSEEDSEEKEKEKSNVGSKGGGVSGDNDELVSETMESFEDHLKDLVDTETEYSYGRVPEVDLDQIIVPMEKWNALVDEFDKGNHVPAMDHAKERFIKFRSENKSLVSYLAKEFEMRKKADEHKRTKVAKTGILNPNKLHSYKFNEDLFLRSEVITSGKNHGFIMYLDWSGSMHDTMANTIDQLMLLALFCKKINVPFEAYAFTDRWSDDPNDDGYSRHSGYHKFNKVEINDVGISKNFGLLHLASSTLSTSKFQTSMKYLARLRSSFRSNYGYRHEIPNALQLGGTPLGECIISAINMVPEFQKKNNVQIVNTIFLTDGQGHNGFTLWNGSEYTNPEYHSTTVIVDPVTKKHYNISRRDYNNGVDSTLLKILSDRTKSRVIGFYIAPTTNKKSFKREMGYSGVEWSKQEEIWNEMKKNNFIVLEDTKGYDQYVWVSSKSLNINTNAIAIDSDMTKGRMKNAFIKQRQGKFGNKVMLSKLAEFVS